MRFLSSFALFLLGSLLALRAQGPLVLSYQGKISVGVAPFTGNGSFKFALVNAAGNQTYWSPDGTSSDASAPTFAFVLPVLQGVYSVQLGEVSPATPQPIALSALQPADVRLRIWFNDGVNGFQLLSPDVKLSTVPYAAIAATVAPGGVGLTQLGQGAVQGTVEACPESAGSQVFVPGRSGAAILAQPAPPNPSKGTFFFPYELAGVPTGAQTITARSPVGTTQSAPVVLAAGQTLTGINFSLVPDPITVFRDADGDGFGNPSDTLLHYCAGVPSGYVINNLDFNDSCASCKPGAPEICGDGFDNDNNGLTDALDPNCTAICGDLTTHFPEQCDDGNTANGDGCSAACVIEAASEIEPNNDAAGADSQAASLPIQTSKLVTGIINAVDDVDWYKVVLPSTGVLRAETFSSWGASGGNCTGISTVLRLRDSAGLVLTTDNASGIGSCSAISRHLAAGTYYVEVAGSGTPPTSYFLQLSMEGPEHLESEPNNQLADADSLGLARVLLGGHPTATDDDWYAVDVPGGASLRIEVIEGSNAEVCESNGIDSRLDLYSSGGIPLATNDDSGRGFCSLIDGTGSAPANLTANTLPAGTYYIRVSASSFAAGAAAQFDYRIVVTIR